MRKLQSQGVHHITLVGADRETSIGFWEGVLGMPFVFEQPNLDKASESHLYFDPGDGRLITIFTDENRKPVQRRTPTEPGCVHHIAFSVSRVSFLQAVERLDERGIKHSGVKDRGFMDFDLLRRPARPSHRARLLSFRAAGRAHARRRAVRGPSHPHRTRRLQHRRDTPRRCDRNPGRALAAIALGGPLAAPALYRQRLTKQEGETSMTVALKVLKPSVNNMAVRVFVRAAGLPFEEQRRLRQDARARVPGGESGASDADDRGCRPAEGGAVGELRDHAVPLQQA